MVIDALVRARLLGLQLLTLEARVVVGTEDGLRRAVRPPLVYSVTDRPEPRSPALDPDPGADQVAAPAPGLARAVQLVEEGADTLERSRRRSVITAGRRQS